jgi:hypothetical protein
MLVCDWFSPHPDTAVGLVGYDEVYKYQVKMHYPVSERSVSGQIAATPIAIRGPSPIHFCIKPTAVGCAYYFYNMYSNPSLRYKIESSTPYLSFFYVFESKIPPIANSLASWARLQFL